MRGLCPCCGRDYALRGDRTVWAHGWAERDDGWAHCPGSAQRPGLLPQAVAAEAQPPASRNITSDGG